MADRSVLIVSNRGPVSFEIDEATGALSTNRGSGGLISGLAPIVEGSDTTWIYAALSDGDRLAAEQGVEEADGFRVRVIAFDDADYRAAYDDVSNATLWFVHHGLFDTAREPNFDRAWHEAWAAYRRVNCRFAEVVAEQAPQGAVVLVQDYHLSLLAAELRERRPDVTSVYFHHTPFARPGELAVLPESVVAEYLSGLAANDACGFHTTRWADAFEACCRDVLGTTPNTFVSPLATDPADIREAAATPQCDAELAKLDGLLGDRLFIARTDRIEPSKNMLRGLHAFCELLETHPEWIGRVVMGAFAYPSRERLAQYVEYRSDVETTVAEINKRFATADWTPVQLDIEDNFPRSVAALRRFDVLLVNPVRDGLNLVATEGILVNERAGSVVLSNEAGAYATFADVVDGVHPFDVSATAEAMHAALSRSADERRSRHDRALALAESRTPKDWYADQLAAAAGPPAARPS